MTIEIVHINKYPEFFPVVAKWYMSFWGEKYPERTLHDWELFIGRNIDKPPLTLIAIDTSKRPIEIVGTASIKLSGMGQYEANSPWLSAVFVPYEYRDKKIASTLIVEIIKIASKEYADIYLFTRTDGRIYKKLGWDVIETSQYQGSIVRIMKKSLSPSLANNNQSFMNSHLIKVTSQKPGATLNF